MERYTITLTLPEEIERVSNLMFNLSEAGLAPSPATSPEWRAALTLISANPTGHPDDVDHIVKRIGYALALAALEQQPHTAAFAYTYRASEAMWHIWDINEPEAGADR